jgi:site-specific recombinase XerD
MHNRPTTPRGNRPTTPRRAGTPWRASTESASALSAPVSSCSTLRQAISSWLADGKAQGWSPRTLRDRRQTRARFCWWLEKEERVAVAPAALTPARIRAFLAYAREPCPGGRYGSDHHGSKREARPATVNAYYRCLRAFVNFCLAEGLLDETPLKNVKAPRVPNDQIQPLSKEQVQALVDATRRTQSPERNLALVLLLVDTGMRVSELCGLRVEDVDRGTGELVVLGKGGKKRQVYMGATTRRALWRYLEADRRLVSSDEALFVSVGGIRSGAGLTPNGVHQVVKKAGRAAGLVVVRPSPHTLRHTFAVNFLRGGGNLFELQQLMGHTDLTVLRRYVALAEADLAQAHRTASPADRMKLK